MKFFNSFTLALMSAGDNIDRAVWLYRRNFLALLRIVLAPSLVAYAGSILMSIGWRNATISRGDERIVITVLLVLSGFMLWAIGKAALFAVFGGSSRSLVAHFFEGKPILARDVYRAAWERIWSLIGATFMVGLLIIGAMMIAYYFIVTIGMFVVLSMRMALQKAPEWMLLAAMLFVAAVILVVAFLLICSRVVYVPHILVVEGKGVFSSIGRSFSLAGGQLLHKLLRIAALIIFWGCVGWSALLLLYLPVGYVSDRVNPFGAEQAPWFNIALQTVEQLSEILVMPILMIGCTLLYLDSRIRKEGFDVEMVANRTLAQPPAPPPLYPTAPEWTPAPQQRGSFAYSILGLDDYSPTPINPAPAQGARLASEVALKICDWCGAETNLENRFCSICGSAFDHWRGAEGVGDPSPIEGPLNLFSGR
jgi:hypothetical protein